MTLAARLRSWVPLARAVAVGTALLAAAAALALIFDRHESIARWLFFRYALAGALTLVFSAAVLSVGNLVVSALTTPGERLDAHVTISFAAGIYVFFLASFAVGILGGYGPVAFVAIPLVLFACGAPKLYRSWQAWRVHHGPALLPALRGGEALGLGIGAVALFLLYVPTLAPENILYDARWYHLALAEHYTAVGGITRLPEGPIYGTITHLASLLYAWAFLLPGSELFDRVVLASHLEFATFLFTLPGLSALVRYLVPGSRARLAWLALFCFPVLFLYDSTFGAGADHVAATFAIPTYLLLVRAYRDLRPRACVLLALMLAGLIMTKYTALTGVLFPVAAVIWRALVLGVQRLRGRIHGSSWLLGPLSALAVGLLVTAPHWLKNWLWYGDPIYPLLYRWLPVRPWNPDGELMLRVYKATAWGAQDTTAENLKGAVRALYNYSLSLYTWPSFHASVPVVGSLFTFGLVALPFLGKTQRLWALVIASHVGIFAWYLLHHNERYLQTLMPWMASAVAAIALRVWQLGGFARLGLIALGAVQIVWGFGLIFYPTHQMTGRANLAYAIDFFRLPAEQRTRPFEDLASIGRELPPGSKVLLHHDHTRLGLGKPTVTDSQRIQYGISYGAIGSPSALHRLLREYGVSHVTWQSELVFGDDSLASELVFHTYASQDLLNARSIGARKLGELPPRAPPERAPRVFFFGCDGSPANGLFELRDLHVSPLMVPGDPPHTFPPPREPLANDVAALADRAGYAVVDRRCPGAPKLAGFQRVARWSSKDLFAREKP